MDLNLLSKVESKELLAILTDKHNNIMWKSSKSPVSEMYKDYFQKKFSEHEPYILYANQAGMALGIMITKLNIIQCHAAKMSEYGLKLFEKSGIKFDYKELIPLVKSSKDENKVCPIEKFLSEHDETDVQWDFLVEQFKNNEEPHNTCEWKPKAKN